MPAGCFTWMRRLSRRNFMGNYLSVDCGGTKTAFLLCGERGEKKAYCVLGPANYMVNGVKCVMDILKDGVERVCGQAGIKREELRSGFIAIAGFGDIPEDMPGLIRQAEELFPGLPLTLGNDTENAMAGSLLLKQGIHVIAGTGSIGLGCGRDGVQVRSGGWHHLFGGDEGSGYWIGCRLIQHFTKQADGREAKTGLYSYLIETFRLKNSEAVLDLVIGEWEGRREKIAALSVHAYELAKRGDACAREIFAEVGYELSLIVRSIYVRGNFDDPLNISYSGGVFKAMEYLRPAFDKALSDIPHRILDPRLSPAAGGIVLALKAVGEELNEERLANLGQCGV